MNKKLKMLSFLLLAMGTTTAVTFGVAQGVVATSPKVRTVTVDFFNNYAREDFVLSNGIKAKGNNLLYKSVEAKELSLLEKPEDPTRKNYDFAGWFKETSCENEWDFANDKLSGNLRLFAKWTYSTAKEDQEPAYVPPSTLPDWEGGLKYRLDSVMNFKIKDGQVKLPRAAISRLEANKDDVLSLMEYKKQKDLTVTATYASNTITFKCGEDTETIAVKDISNDLILDNATYETKAKNYEAKYEEENENYHVMLAGSSSIEFWTSSKEDLNPIVSYNHGIGGTTIEEWTNSLNQRLVYPYKPKMVVYYVGINNVINSKQSADTIWNNLKTFFDETHEALPNTKVQYILMNLIPGFKEYFATIEAVNAQAINYQKNNSWLTLINPGEALLKANGEPNAAYFRTDGLHLSYYGYVVWGAVIKDSIVKGLENN